VIPHVSHALDPQQLALLALELDTLKEAHAHPYALLGFMGWLPPINA